MPLSTEGATDTSLGQRPRDRIFLRFSEGQRPDRISVNHGSANWRCALTLAWMLLTNLGHCLRLKGKELLAR